ncbi:LysR substrate-binding domain-containing protein, partial [Pseudaminobacter salicylatoxidans]|uniref:LysR substrate-binding domain-containing protein n=1 Tax=Pseudaminobacter salicylatoxidans TaxID=93369 RepID=UPI001FCB1B95
PLKSSSLVARKLGETTLIIVAAPSYLERYGEPRSIADLEGHNRLGFGYARTVDGWPLRENGKAIVMPATGRVQASDGEGLRIWRSLAWVLLVSQPSLCENIAAERLVPVLDNLDTGQTEAFHAVYVGQGGPLSSRVRALLDFLAEKSRVI